jgi:hypothetical protein
MQRAETSLVVLTEERVRAPVEPAPTRTRPRRTPLALVATVAAEAAAAAGLVAVAETVARRHVVLVAAAVGVGLVGARAVTGLAAGHRAGRAAAVLLCGARVVVLLTVVGVTDETRQVVLLVGLSGIPVVAGLLALVVVPRITHGERDALVTGLGAAAVSVGIGALAVVALARGWLPGQTDELAAVAPYVAGAAGMLAFAETLARHHVGAGFGRLVTPMVALAVAAELAAFAVVRGAAVDVASTGLVVAGTVAAVGLAVMTVASSPLPMVVAPEEAAGGPRLIAPTLVLLAGMAVVARVAAVRPLWLDEATLVEQAQAPFDVIVRSTTAHPPLFDLLVSVPAHRVDVGAVGLRVPGIVLGVLLVLALYATATELFSRRAGIVAAAIGAVGPGLVWMSARVQPEMLAALLGVVAVLGFVRWARRGRWRELLVFIGAGVLLIWTHQLGFVHVVVLVVAGAVVAGRHGWRPPWGAGWAVSAAATAVSVGVLLAVRGGIGPERAGFPLEFATTGAPSGSQTVMGVSGTLLAALIGYHPSDVTSRLLAMWPFLIVIAFVAFGRRWSPEGALVIALAAAPFAALVALQIAGAPRQPPLALGWVATAVPMVVILVAQGISVLSGRWSRTRVLAVLVSAVLVVALVDQTVRTRVERPLDVDETMDVVEDWSRPGDTVVYSPRSVGQLVRYRLPDDVRSIPLGADPTIDPDAPRVFVVSLTALDRDRRAQAHLRGLMRDLGASRTLVRVDREPARTVWEFG